MSLTLSGFAELAKHIQQGHGVVISIYGDDDHYAIECEDCAEVIAIFYPDEYEPESIPIRYTSREEAVEGHEEAMRIARGVVIGDRVLVPDPTISDLWNHSFVGSVISVYIDPTTGFEIATVEDSNGDYFDVETHRLCLEDPNQ